MEPKWLRLAYVFEFLLALMAVFALWSQVGGQGHLDLMAWWWKLIVGVGGAFAVVRATMAAVAAERAWNRRTLSWLLVVLALAAGAGLLVYYYHTYAETDEEQQEEENVPALLSGPICSGSRCEAPGVPDPAGAAARIARGTSRFPA